MEEHLQAKGRLIDLPNPPEKDQFLDKLFHFKRNARFLFPYLPQKNGSGIAESIIKPLVKLIHIKHS